ncbi:MAG: tRNA (adenosine(37)-N6)-threonylcarbamoyltransferase complex ATPase subunit type 1 TsaE [Dysgonamonadaceae bacterium]|nr:tRNA (adenosine(37)-N6)-threonylcarbamoyltransferase complex ATPase subunit type 1 TsaE [Dysgonamonadaceae bacterium]
MHFIRIKNLETIREAAGEFIRRMNGHTVFAFNGAMGAGKTTFIKALCEQLGVTDAINSPTFAIVNEYRTAAEMIYHFDFYRVDTEREAYDLGLSDYFDSGALCFIEWPDKVASLLPEHTVFVAIVEQEDGSRTVRLSETATHS